jgi:kynurenine formamidase
MRIQTFVIGYVLALALFVFAQRHTEAAPSATFHAVVDLTNATASHSPGTTIDAPARFARGMWTVDQIPAERLIAPLVVLDVSSNAQRSPDYQVSVEDIASWERVNGQVPLGAIVMAHTGSHAKSARPGFSDDAAKFLIEGRKVLGLGIDAQNIDAGSNASRVRDYALAHSVYPLQNVANLERVPSTGAVIVVAPEKTKDATTAPVRLFALLR